MKLQICRLLFQVAALPVVSAVCVVALAPLHAGTETASSKTTIFPEAEDSALSEWWNGKYATGNWWGIRDTLNDHGIEPFGLWKGVFYGITGGGGSSARGTFAEELVFGMVVDFGKLAGIEGLSAKGSVRYRDGRGPNFYTDAGGSFSPSAIESGLGWRLMPFYLTYVTPELFGIEHFLTISGGWQDPWEYFADQPNSNLFTNAAINTVKGIGGVNEIPFTTSYAAWGGYLKVEPTDWFYGMAGLYMAIPDATKSSNHGLYFAGNPGNNGMYFLAETGLTPKIGSSQLPGKYAFGSIYWGVDSNSFNGTSHPGRTAFYWQADQMLFRESEAVLTVPMGKGSKQVLSGTPSNVRDHRPVEDDEYGPKLGKKKADTGNHQGLYSFTFFNFAPEYNNAMPFYFQTGLVYKGLIPTRDYDQFGAVIGYGNYSYDKIQSENMAGISTHQTYEAVIEVDYRLQVNRWMYVQPFWQYIIRPNGTGQTGNLNILGLQMAVNF